MSKEYIALPIGFRGVDVEVTIGDSGDYEIEVIVDNGKRKYAKYFDNDYEAQQWIEAQPFKVTCTNFS